MTRGQQAVLREDDRRGWRSTVAIDAEVRIGTNWRITAAIRNLSITGFRISSGYNLPDDAVHHMIIPGFEPLPFRIVWIRNGEYGCAFEKPLHQAVCDHIARIYPAGCVGDQTGTAA